MTSTFYIILAVFEVSKLAVLEIGNCIHKNFNSDIKTFFKPSLLVLGSIYSGAFLFYLFTLSNNQAPVFIYIYYGLSLSAMVFVDSFIGTLMTVYSLDVSIEATYST